MSDPATPPDDAMPSLGEVLNWRNWQTWAMFLGIYLGMGLGIGVAFILAQFLVHKLLPFENAYLNEFLEFGFGMAFYIAGFLAISLPLARKAHGKAETVVSVLLKYPNTFVAHGCGSILGAVTGQIVMHILRYVIDLPYNSALLFVLMAIVFMNGLHLLIIGTAARYQPAGETDTKGI